MVRLQYKSSAPDELVESFDGCDERERLLLELGVVSLSVSKALCHVVDGALMAV